ncbi:MAG: hypothetical protein CL928_10025, partial [Deltaproteobacteria bacterium]|nr:hypothetical protein [Deltaproteobacteria bacterium]
MSNRLSLVALVSAITLAFSGCVQTVPTGSNDGVPPLDEEGEGAADDTTGNDSTPDDQSDDATGNDTSGDDTSGDDTSGDDTTGDDTTGDDTTDNGNRPGDPPPP